jgi:hypothetical protein
MTKEKEKQKASEQANRHKTNIERKREHNENRKKST